MNSIANGIWAGTMANGAMTLALMKLQKDFRLQQALPPAKITGDLLAMSKVDLDSSDKREELSMLLHYAYGVGCALLYVLAEDKVKLSPVTKGAAYGAGIWACSYLGWVPALKMRPAATQVSASRNMQMILSHLVWGASLGFAVQELKRAGNQLWDGKQKFKRTDPFH